MALANAKDACRIAAQTPRDKKIHTYLPDENSCERKRHSHLRFLSKTPSRPN